MKGIDRRMLVAGSAAAATCIGRPAVVRAAEPLKVNAVLANAIHWVQCVAVEKGFYRDSGFDPNLSVLQSSPQSIQFILSGELHVATAQPETFVAAVEQGATDLAAIAAPTNHCDWVLAGARGVKTLADIKGKSVGLSSLRATEAWLTARLLEQKGLKKSDYSFVVGGTSPAKVAALEADAVGAAVLFQPTAEAAIRQGLVPLASYQNLRAYPTILYVVKKEWAAMESHGKRVAAALRRSHEWLWNPANREEALQILAKYAKRERPVLETVYDQYFVSGKLYSKTGAIERAGLRVVLADMALDGTAFKVAPAPEKFILVPNLGGLST